MPELTVSMPAFNTARYIRVAIESVLRQTGIDLELIVVDDASQDDTGEVVRSFKDSRVKLLTNRINRGISYCHNLVIQRSASPFIAHVDSDDLILPHALQKMVGELKGDPKIGQAHCYFFDIDENGRATPEALLLRRESFVRNRPQGMDYKRELLVRGTVINHLRTSRREVFAEVGYFNENLRYGEDYEMALRITDKYQIKLVPEFLYYRRVHESNTTSRLGFNSWGFFFQRLRICRQLSNAEKLQFLKEGKYNLNRLMLTGFCETLRYTKLRNLVPEVVKLVRNGSL